MDTSGMDARLFPASIVDELTYCVERTWSNLHLIYAWIFTLEGEISTEVVQKALDQALSYYPKCKCILVNNYASYKHWFRYRWKLTEYTATEILSEIQLPIADASINDIIQYYVCNHNSLSIDLSFQVPLKVLLFRQSNRNFLCFIMHHALADGGGSIAFIKKFITLYEDIYYQRKSNCQKDTRLEDISLPNISFQWSHFSPRLLLPYLRYASLLRNEPPVRLYTHQLSVDSAEFVAGIYELPPQCLEAISTTTKKHQATINDYLLAAAFQTIKNWSRTWLLPSECIYITAPINLRSPEDINLTNNFSSINVSLTPAKIGKKDTVLPMIRKQMADLSKNEIATTMLNLSCLLKPIPITLRIPLLKRSIPSFAPTLLLSNLGVLSPNPSHTDDEGYNYLGPARICNVQVIPNAGAWPDVLVSTYNRHMVITIAVLSSCFSCAEANQFLKSFVEHL